MKKISILFFLAALVCSCGPGRQYTNVTDPGNEVVNIGYQKILQKDNTGSTSSLKVERGSGYTDIYEYLRGRVAGVDVNGTRILIRGVQTINGTNEPLILVDGMETSDISNISPDEVERIDVLKDASTTAMYGSRGANGVILITTRRSVK